MGDGMKNKLETSTKFTSFNEKVYIKNSKVKDLRANDESARFKFSKKWQKETYNYVKQNEYRTINMISQMSARRNTEMAQRKEIKDNYNYS